MKRSSVFVVVLFVLVTSLIFLDFSKSKTIAHHEGSNSSSSSSGQIVLNKNFAGLWKARVAKPISSNASSSSGSNECVICIQVVPQCLPDQELVPQTCTECAHCISSGSGGQTIFRRAHINEGFSGSRIIAFKLCVKDGKLEGTVQQTDVIEKGTILSQNIISDNEVNVTFEDKQGVTANITLKLLNGRKFIGTFMDNHTFEARKINSLKSCGKNK